jgi:hypothetical protein
LKQLADNQFSPRLLDLLGEGGMGAVYRAFDRLTGETIALKHVAVTPGELRFTSPSHPRWPSRKN